MRVDYFFLDGTVTFNQGESFNIESLRRYAINFHPSLVKPFFIKAIRIGSKIQFTYDYDAFFSTIDTNFIRQYKKYLSSCYDDHVKPVEGIIQVSEHLDLIFEAVKKQFIIDGHEFKLLNGRLDRETGRANHYPLLVFVGIADMHGFPNNQIASEAQIDAGRIKGLIEEFIASIKEKNRVYTKTLLVLNDLRFKLDKFVDLGDLGS